MQLQIRLLLPLVMLASQVSPAIADLTPESVLLVVNGGSQSSLTVANEYVHLRRIPTGNVVTLTGLTNVEQLSVDEFRKQILGPVLAAIEQRGLKSQIRCVAYSTDFPTAIHVNPDVGDAKLPQVLTPVASINGLTFLHQLTMAKDIRYLDLNINTYARRIGARSTDTPWQPEELKRYAEAVQRLQLNARRRRDAGESPADALQTANDPASFAAIKSLNELRSAHPHSADLLYNLACSLAISDRTEEALEVLKEAVSAGWFDYRHAARDPDFASIADRAEFKNLLEAMKSAILDVQPALGFRSDVAWLPNGSPTTKVDQPRFLLSTVLGVTAGRGMAVSEVIANLKRSASADGIRPAGTVYYMRNGDVRSTTREWGFASAAAKLKQLGIDATVTDGVLPQKQDRVAGAMIGIADFDWSKSESTIAAGAIVEHLTSFGGVMTSGAGQTPLIEFLRHGAAGASGTVTEPYAIQAKFPNPFIHAHYASGVSLAEAFYLSVTGPYQLLIVGDPLCNPWRPGIEVSCETPPRSQPWAGRVRLSPKAAAKEPASVAKIALFVDGQQIATGPPDSPIEIDTTSLVDGDHHLTVVAFNSDAVESTGRWIASFSVRNNSEFALASLKSRSGESVSLDQPLEIEASYPEATTISIQHLGREVAHINGQTGTAVIPAGMLGSGMINLQLKATTPTSTKAGPSLTITVTPRME